MILQFVARTLEQAGYRVKAVNNAADALDCYAAAGTDPFRLVLSDVIMPRVNGVDLARKLLTHDANARILFMSGQVSPDFAHEEFADRQVDLLSKPFRPEGLLRAVRGALDRGTPIGPKPLSLDRWETGIGSDSTRITFTIPGTVRETLPNADSLHLGRQPRNEAATRRRRHECYLYRRIMGPPKRLRFP